MSDKTRTDNATQQRPSPVPGGKTPKHWLRLPDLGPKASTVRTVPNKPRKHDLVGPAGVRETSNEQLRKKAPTRVERPHYAVILLTDLLHSDEGESSFAELAG